jgi:hypothetical protein
LLLIETASYGLAIGVSHTSYGLAIGEGYGIKNVGRDSQMRFSLPMMNINLQNRIVHHDGKRATPETAYRYEFHNQTVA